MLFSPVGRLLSGLMLLLGASATQAQITDWQKPEPFRGETVDPAAKVTEDDYEVPPLPEKVEWQEFYLNASTRNSYYIAREPLMVGKDGAIRYISRVVAPSGTENIAAEALRCGTGERKVYATLRSNREWAPTRGSRWIPIGGGNRLNSYPFMLYSDYMCADGFALQPKKVLERLADSFNARTGTPLTGYR
jgi:hypothetical protein